MTETYDALILGAGPAGATAALTLARKGLRALVIDRAKFPHFHIGESLLPRNFRLLHDLGLAERAAKLPQTAKFGAEFITGHGRDGGTIRFADGLIPGSDRAMNLERGPFDAMLLDAAREAGAEVIEGCAVRGFPRLADGDVAVELSDGRTVEGRWLIDASGQSTLVGKHLGLRRLLPHLKKVAYFGHFKGVERSPGVEGGFIRIVMCEEGWFWLIPLDEERTSIGLVLDDYRARQAEVPADRMLAWGIERAPLVARWTANAEFSGNNGVIADFSYRCTPYAGPGYFLVGDAATFVDPIFSTGVCLAMMSAVRAAEEIVGLLGGAEAKPARRRYIRYLEGSSTAFFRMVDLFYDPAFRDLFMSGEGPLQIHRAIISLFAGEVFPRPAFSVRWRLRLFDLFCFAQRRYPFQPRRERWSLFSRGVVGAADRSSEPARPLSGSESVRNP
ncbi:MAG TPA: NAD(P)/FAD-dependent oxidoreductase [Thermoanaerobaculia bacterium]|nr:NAD(P)/FAD-dependent oxidoreductase [Thermoanaerobaculia bacterium]